MVIFERVAALFLPSDDTPAAIVEAGDDWSFDPTPLEDASSVVWGRPPRESGLGLRAAVGFARKRARALDTLRGKARLDVREAHRWPPPIIDAGGARNAIKRGLLSGVVVELSGAPGHERVVDRVVARSGVALDGPLIPSSGGSLRAFVRAGSRAVLTAGESPPELRGRHLLRLGAQGSPADPGSNATALERLARVGGGRVPRLLDRGATAGASWSVESIVPGHRPRRLSRDLVAQTVAFCARLPRSPGPATALASDLNTVARHLPDRARTLRAVLEDAGSTPSAWGAIARHGDLWGGNLLVEGSELSGIVDWDAWHESGLVGSDLMHLVSSSVIAPGASLGARWSQRPWRDDVFVELATPYWNALELAPTESDLELVALGWWAAQVASSLERLPHLAARPRWLEENVEPVLRRVAP